MEPPGNLDRIIVPGTRDVQPSFVPVAKHYGAIVEPCPPRRGNRYSVPPGLSGSTLEVHQRLGTSVLEIRSPNGSLLASHHLAHDGAGVVVRDLGHSAALERVVLAQFTSKRPCDKKAHVGISDAALTEAARLLGDAGRAVNVDLEDYARLVAS